MHRSPAPTPAPRARTTLLPSGTAPLRPTPGTTIRDTVLGVGTARRLRRCVASLDLPEHPDAPPPLVTDAELEGLPPAAPRWLRTMGVVGRPRTWFLRARFAGRFRPGADKPWMPCTAWQYNTALGSGRAYSMRVDVAGLLPMTGTDTYVRGRGAMRGSVLGLVRVADGSGPEFDLGELTTYVNDAVLLAPSMLLVPAVTWRGVDDSTFEVTLVDAALRTTSTVTLGDDALPVEIVSEDRFCDLPSGRVRAPWWTPISGWERLDDRWFPREGRAVWRLPDGDLEYAHGRFLPASVALDLPASAAARGVRRQKPS